MQKTKIFIGVLVLSTILSNLAFAEASHTDAKGNGNANTILETGVIIEKVSDANFGTITRFGPNTEGTKNVEMDENGNITSNSENIKTNPTGTPLQFKITTPTNTDFYYNEGDKGMLVRLANANGSKKIRTMIFKPEDMYPDKRIKSGTYGMRIVLILDDEPDGEYSTTNPGGTPFELTINY